MKSRLAICATAVALAAAPFGAQALGKSEKGCLVGGAAGGVGGHLIGNHGLLGAAVGCGVGTLVAKNKDKKEQAAKKQEVRETRHAERVQQREANQAAYRAP